MDYYIKTDTKETLNSKLLEAQVLDSIDPYLVNEKFALDIIGTIYKETGRMVSTEAPIHMDYPEMLPIEGFHANLRGELSEDQLVILDSILLKDAPKNPSRIWA